MPICLLILAHAQTHKSVYIQKSKKTIRQSYVFLDVVHTNTKMLFFITKGWF